MAKDSLRVRFPILSKGTFIYEKRVIIKIVNSFFVLVLVNFDRLSASFYVHFDLMKSFDAYNR
jgi:hypothetical protein